MFPIKLAASRSLLEEWAEDEFASWEDAGCPEEGHVRPILLRMKTRLLIKTPEELDLVLRSGEYQGDLGGWGDGRAAHRSAIHRLTARLQAEAER